MKGYTLIRRGGIALVDQRNHSYIRNRKSESTDRIWWLCSSARRKGENCKARLITIQNKVIKMSGEHNHPAPEACYEYTGFTAPNF